MRKYFTLLAFLTVLAANAIQVQAAGVEPGELNKKISEARTEFNSLSKQEKKTRMKEARKMLKDYKQDVKKGKAKGEGEESKVLLAILAILLPPLAVYLHENQVNSKFWISILLTLLFWIPGVIYALIVVLS
jgi:uncharacterized membrane protein YqaE (UPF0057 family)